MASKKHFLRLSVLCIFAAAFFTAALVMIRLQLFMSEPLQLKQTVEFEVPNGSSVTSVNRRLFEAGLVGSPIFLAWHARLHNQIAIQAGEYRLEPGITTLQTLEKMLSGDVVQYSVSLIEGWQVKDVLTMLIETPRLQSELRGLSEDEIIVRLGITEPSLEGLFFPDTYHYVAGSSDQDLLKRAYERTQTILQQEWQQRAENLPYQNAYEALIMASIVEKETGVPHERADIAGVFVRRLQRGMKLQTDPTVIYGLGERYQGNLKRKHLSEKTAYNTYVIHGLPPTPIALAGREAIHAALHPADGKSLYFVAKGDGSHYFSETLEEHNRAVKQYQLTRRADYRSSPAANSATAAQP